VTVPENESIQSARSWPLILSDIARLLLILGIVSGIVWIAVTIKVDFDLLKCMLPDSPWEILLGAGGMIGLAALGLPFAPATVFGLATWAIIKFLTCQH